MHHSCNQANFRLLTSPITDNNSQSSLDFVCLKRRKGAKRALENPHRLGSQPLHTTVRRLHGQFIVFNKKTSIKGDLNPWRRSGRLAYSLTALCYQSWIQALGYATETCTFFYLCCLALLWYELPCTILEPGCNLNGIWLSYRPGQTEALGKFPNHGKVQPVLERCLLQASEGVTRAWLYLPFVLLRQFHPFIVLFQSLWIITSKINII